MIDKIKCDRIAGFLTGAQRLGYDIDSAWDLLLNSRQGIGMLNNDYEFSVHHQGITSAIKADADYGFGYNKTQQSEPDISQMNLLAELIEIAHNKFDVSYEKMFSKTKLSEFMRICGNALGDYDDKLIKAYII